MPSTEPEGNGAGDYLHVVAAAVEREGRILIALRSPDRHQGGLWEFPGGKVEPGESARDALARELHEELGIAVRGARPLIQVYHRYPDRSVFLDVWRVDSFAGQPHGREGQPVRWVEPDRLGDFAFPAANTPIVAAVRLPDRYLITPEPGAESGWPVFLSCLTERLRAGAIELVQFRAKALTASQYRGLAARVIEACHAEGARVILNADPHFVTELGADGVQLSSERLKALETRPLTSEYWVGASCHDRSELQRAAALGCDFAVLSPVQPTATHPVAQALGWSRFGALVREVALPVFALGGLTAADLPLSWEHGAQGIAAIRGLWESER